VAVLVRGHRGNVSVIQSQLEKLEHWSTDGRNHVVINLNPNIDLIELGLKPKGSIFTQSTFKTYNFRAPFDLVYPPIIEPTTGPANIVNSPPICPAKRKYLLTFQDYLQLNESDAITFNFIAKLKELEKLLLVMYIST
jgi:hypothetical protein